MSRFLAAHHRESLEVGSSITPGIIEQRGYWTAIDEAELGALGFSPEQCLVPSLVVPVFGVDGEIVSYQHKPDSPRSVDGKPIKYESLPGAPPRLDIPPSVRAVISDPGESLMITEGAKKADSAAGRGINCIDLSGVWNWRGTNTRGGSTELADWEAIAIKKRLFYLAFDSDVTTKPQVLQALRRLAAFLKRRGASDVRPIIIPSKDGAKVGLDDFFVAGGTKNELLACVDKEILRFSGIVINNRSLADITQDALEAILESNDPPSIFEYNGELVRIREDKRHIAKLEPLSIASLRGIMVRCATWLKTTKDGASEVIPPAEVVQDLMALGQWATDSAKGTIPIVEAITRAPILAPDGTITTDPGYCPKSRFYLASAEKWEPWHGSVQDAVRFLFTEVLGDFPFADDASKAHALALMILPIVRPIIDGPTPLHLIDAPVQGTGKSLLAKVCLMPTAGDIIGATTGTRDEEEWRKKIASSLLEGRTYVFLDNLSRKVDSDSLAGVLTSSEWNDRALSTMRNINVPVRCAWVATANNAELSRDILRRTAWIRLDAGVERPEDRKKFRHPNIELWVSENRVKIVAALCELVRAWSHLGRPATPGRLLGSFEEWSKTIGGILETADVCGFLSNVNELRSAAGGDDSGWGNFYTRWNRAYGNQPMKAGMLLPLFEEDEMLAGLLGDKGESSRKTRLGHLLRKRVGIIASGLLVEKFDDGSSSTSYRVLGFLGSKTQNPTQTLPDDLGSNSSILEGLEGFESFSGPHAHAPAPAHTQDDPPTNPKNPKTLQNPTDGELIDELHIPEDEVGE